MSEILLVNPRRRRRRRNPESHAKRVRAAKLGWRHRRHNPRRSRRRNPESHATRVRAARAGWRHRRHHHRRRHNPAPRLTARSVQNQMMSAIPGAVGALLLDVIMGYAPIPATWKSGVASYVTKSVGAIGLGMAAAKVVSASTASRMTEGALTVMFHGILRQMMAQFAPGVPVGMYLEGLGYSGAGWNPDVYYQPNMSMYLPQSQAQTLPASQPGYDVLQATDLDYQ